MLSGIFTAFLILLFLGIVAWAYSVDRRLDFSQAAQLPLEKPSAPESSQ